MNCRYRLLRNFITELIYQKQLLLPSRGITVLLYHKINDHDEPDIMTTPTSLFKKQMDFLKLNNFNILSLSEFLMRKNKKKDELSGSKDILITYDDGWEDNYTKAFPILKEFSFTATIFVTTGMVDRDDNYLTSKQIKEMSAYGIDFGAHSVNHNYLTSIPLKQAKNEIRTSKVFLENLIGKPIISFCYPYGDYSDRIIEIIRKNNYECSFTVKPGKNRYSTNNFELRRTELNGNDTISDFKKKLSGAFDILHKIIQLKVHPHEKK